MKISRKCREMVANLSSGQYYRQPQEWWEKLCAILAVNRYIPYQMDCPLFYNDDGHSYIRFDNEMGEHVGNIWYSWHRMESSNWEVVCYIT